MFTYATYLVKVENTDFQDRDTKRQEAHLEEAESALEAYSDVADTLDISAQEFKTALINMLRGAHG